MFAELEYNESNIRRRSLVKEKSKSVSSMDILLEDNSIKFKGSPGEYKLKNGNDSHGSTPSSSSKDRQYYNRNKNNVNILDYHNENDDVRKVKSIKKIKKTWKDIPECSSSSFSVGNWLDYLGLRQYENVFLNNGYDTIETVRFRFFSFFVKFLSFLSHLFYFYHIDVLINLSCHLFIFLLFYCVLCADLILSFYSFAVKF